MFIRYIFLFLRKLKKSFYNTKISKRMLISGIVVICFSSSILTSIYWRQFNSIMVEKYTEYAETAVSTISKNYKYELDKVSNVINLFKKNTVFLEYFENTYMPISERIVTYNSVVLPLINYAIETNYLIDNIEIYSLCNSNFSPPYHFLKKWGKKVKQETIFKVKPNEVFYDIQIDNRQPRITCYQIIYNKDYSQKLAILIIQLKQEALLPAIFTDISSSNVIFQYQKQLYSIGEKAFLSPAADIYRAKIQKFSESGKNVFFDGLKSVSILEFLPFDSEGTGFYFFSNFPYITRNAVVIIYIPVILCTVFFLLFFIMKSASGVKRILAFTQHLERNNKENLTYFNGEAYTDEIGILITVYNTMVNRINTLSQTVLQTEIRMRDARYYALQSQMNPHFLLNSLEEIRMQASINGDEQTAQMIYILGRIMAYNIKSNLITTVKDELEQAQHYFEFTTMKWEGKFHYKIDDFSKENSIPCPKFILQPIIENSFIHGFSGHRKTDPGINISVAVKPDAVFIRVCDNGKGISQEKLRNIREAIENSQPVQNSKKQPGHGSGLKNVHERLKIYNESAEGITLSSTEGKGTICCLKIKIKPLKLTYSSSIMSLPR